MASGKKQLKASALRLLHWTEFVRPEKANDPLGLALRVGARLASQLLYCITSITPRARYFSFLPWCVREYRKNERGSPHDPGLREAVRRREKALVLGCVLHHMGQPCEGGGLVGSKQVKRWYDEGIPSKPDFVNRRFSDNPALGQYLGSLFNLRVFKLTDDQEMDDDQTDLDEDDDEGREVTINDLELDDLGEFLAACYASRLDRLAWSSKLAQPSARLTVEELAEWGRRGGFCELNQRNADDCEALRKLFFDALNKDRRTGRSEAHKLRAASLRLILYLAKQLSSDEMQKHEFYIDADTFHRATYFERVFYWPDGDLTEQAVTLPIRWPTKLRDVMMRWRMFGFHQIMRFALEALLGVVVAGVRDAALAGLPMSEVLRRMGLPGVGRPVNKLLGLPKDAAIWSMPVRAIWRQIGFDADATCLSGSAAFDAAIGPDHVLSESRLMLAWDDHVNTDIGGLIAMLALLSMLARFQQWEDSNWGRWLSKASVDDYLDASPAVVAHRLTERFGKWPDATLGEITEFVLKRFVIEQHQAMSYTKSHDGSRALFWSNGARLHSRGTASWEVVVGNARLRSATSILTDLGCLRCQENGCHEPTADGLMWLERGLS